MKSAQPISVRSYIGIFVALLMLTALTTAVAFVDLGRNLNVVVALAIAGAKAILVALYFMHLRHSSRLSWIFAGAGFFWLFIMIVLTMSDALTRNGFSSAAQ